MKISRERYNELGLGICRESCEDCELCYEEDGMLMCEEMDVSIDDAIVNDFECPLIDEERLEEEMTEEEYDAYRHNRLEIDKGED